MLSALDCGHACGPHNRRMASAPALTGYYFFQWGSKCIMSHAFSIYGICAATRQSAIGNVHAQLARCMMVLFGTCPAPTCVVGSVAGRLCLMHTVHARAA
jgi:hypothetical protein